MKGLSELKEHLKQKQFKMTVQRQRVLSVFNENVEKHLSAEDVYKIMQAEKDGIGLATIYRTLELLCSIGMLAKVNFGDGRARYELNNETETHHHHHLLCLACDKIMEIDNDLFEELESEIADKNGFQIIDHNVTFFGYCKECQNKK